MSQSQSLMDGILNGDISGERRGILEQKFDAYRQKHMGGFVNSGDQIDYVNTRVGEILNLVQEYVDDFVAAERAVRTYVTRDFLINRIDTAP